MCGIFAAFGLDQAAYSVYRGLHAQQHRAVEYAGIVSSVGKMFYRQTGEGTVTTVFNTNDFTRLQGDMALGHIRYSTVEDGVGVDNAQPIVAHTGDGYIAISHNGNLTNVDELRQLVHSPLMTCLDSELMLRLIAESEAPLLENKIRQALSKVRGSFAAVVMVPNALVAVRDWSGNRPLSLGKKGQGYVVASETCAIDAIGATYIREVERGEMVVISSSGLSSLQLEPINQAPAHCIFELIYYAHPASGIFGYSVADFRKRLGGLLEETCPAEGGEVVVPVPDSSVYIAQGYGESGRSGTFTLGITRSHYIGRTFIAKNQSEREARVQGKFQVVASEVRGKNVVLIDDSIVRLTTLPPLIRLLRHAQVRQVHVRIACPPITHPCIYGIDTPTKLELAAANFSHKEIQQKLDVDSLEFLSLDSLQKLVSDPHRFCYACMTGEYPLLQ